MYWYRVLALATLLFMGLFMGGRVGSVAAEEVVRGDSRVRVILDELGYKYTVDSDNDFKLVFEVGNGRTQMIYVNSKTEEIEPFEVREVWSPAYQGKKGFSAKVANLLLEDNFNKKVGSWQSLAISEKGRMAVFTVKLDANANSETLAAILQIVLVTADGMEQKLSGNDAL